MFALSNFTHLQALKIVFLLFLIPFITHQSFAQSVEPRATLHWQNKKSRATAVHALVRNLEGNLVYIGTTNKKSKDINFIVADTSGRILKDTIIIGGDKDDETNAICNTRDGGFLIAGYTRSPKLNYSAKADGWVVKTDFNGKPLWEALIGTLSEDVFTSATEDDKGNFFMSGYSNNALWVVKISSKGEKLWERRIVGTNRQGRSIAYSRRTSLVVIAGFEVKGEHNENLYLTGFDGQGKLVFDKQYPKSAAEKLIEMPNGNWLVAGRQYSFKSNENMLLLQTDSLGTMLKTHLFGGAWEDGAQALAFDPVSETVCLGGYTYSQVRNGHTSQLWLVKSDLNGKELWQKRAYFGGEDNEGARDLLLSPEGQLFAIGYTGKEKKPWLIGFGTIINYKATETINGLFIEQGTVSTTDSNKTVLEQNERGFYEFILKNNSTVPIFPLIATVTPTTKTAQGLWVLPKIDIGQLLAGESRRITIPLSIGDSVTTDTSHFEVKFYVKNIEVGNSIAFNVVTKAPQRPNLRIIDPSFVLDTLQPSIGIHSDATKTNNKKLTLKLTVKNAGTVKAEQTQVRFICPLNINNITPRVVELGDLDRDSTQFVSFECEPEATYDDSVVVIGIGVFSKTALGDTYQEMSINLRKRQYSDMTIREPEYSFDTSPTDKSDRPSFLNLGWINPNGSQEVSEGKPDITLRIFIQADKELDNSNVEIILNGKPLEGTKAKVVPLKWIYDELNNQHSTIFEKNILLEKGKNTIEAKVKNGTIEKKLPKLIVDGQAKKPNLYVIALGVPRPGLFFSTKDAQDFAQVWKNQEGKFFDKVFPSIRNTSELTNKTSIVSLLDSLLNDFMRQKTIAPNDYLIIYISSHGFLNEINGSFNIEPSDYSETIPSKKIGFEADILEAIYPIKCNQILFIDACHSGKAAELSATLAKLFQDRNKDFLYVLSSDANEYSYEDAIWQNSAFTKALIEAFSRQTVQVTGSMCTADTNNDGSLTINELMVFLKKRVYYLVRAEKQRDQNPCLYPKNADKVKNDFEIYKF